MEFQEKSARSDTIDLPLLMTTQEKMAATSTDPIATATGSCDPSSVQSNSSEQLKCQHPHLDGFLSEVAAVEELCNSMQLKYELSPGPEPRAELEESFRLLNSDEGFMKIKGLLSIRLLALNHPETLLPEMKEICLVIEREVMNPWYLASGTAVQTLGDLLRFLKRHFDPFLDWAARMLFQKAATNNEVDLRLTNVALDHMIRSCSPLLCMKALLSVLSYESMPDPDQEAIARELFAAHLHALVESARHKPEMHEVFLSVRHLTQNTSEVARSCAEKTLAILLEHLKESMEFQEKSARSDTIDLPLLMTTQEKMAATSTDPIATATGSCDPSSVQSNSSEQLQDEFLSEVAAVEELCNSMQLKYELSPGPEPRAELEESFRLLNSDEGFMNIKGLLSISLLALHHPETLLPEMKEICLVIEREVMNPWFLASTAAVQTLGDLLRFLKRHFDPFLDWAARMLFQKAATNNKVDLRLTNVALDHMIRSCSPLLCMKALLSVLSYESMPDPDQEAVARELFAAHLHALVESTRHEPEMHEVFLSVRHLTQNTSEVARSCAEKTLAILSEHLKESMEFQEKSARSDTIDLPLLMTTQEKMAATSTDPIATATGSCDPSSVQSNSSEQLQDEFLSEVAAVEELCNSMQLKYELSPGPEPRAELEESFRLLNSDERFMNIKGLLSISLLALHHPETLLSEMKEICLVIEREVMNPWFLASTAAVQTLGNLLRFLKRHFDPFLDWAARMLFQKAAANNEVDLRLTNVALDHMIRSCSPLLCMKALLSVLSYESMPDPDQEAVARELFAAHLHALVESARHEPEMHEVFLSVRHLTQNTSEVARSCAEKTLAILSEHLKESMEFQEKSARSDTIDLPLLMTTQEKMAATSTDPIATATGSCDPSSVQSNSSEQLKCQHPHLDGALSEEAAVEELCNSMQLKCECP